MDSSRQQRNGCESTILLPLDEITARWSHTITLMNRVLGWLNPTMSQSALRLWFTPGLPAYQEKEAWDGYVSTNSRVQQIMAELGLSMDAVRLHPISFEEAEAAMRGDDDYVEEPIRTYFGDLAPQIESVRMGPESYLAAMNTNRVRVSRWVWRRFLLLGDLLSLLWQMISQWRGYLG